MNPTDYPPALTELLALMPLAPLGPGEPLRDLRPKIEAACAVLPMTCRAGLWLAFDFLDESHAISQDVETPEGSFWHAIMHRREPDASNSKYWFRQVGSHPVLSRLAEEAPALGYDFSDPFAFVDFVERARGSGTADEGLAKKVQLLEWQLLFDHCYRKAVGA